MDKPFPYNPKPKEGRPTASVRQGGDLHFSNAAMKLMGLTEDSKAQLLIEVIPTKEQLPNFLIAVYNTGFNQPDKLRSRQPQPLLKSGHNLYLRTEDLIANYIVAFEWSPKYLMQPSKAFPGEFELNLITPIKQRKPKDRGI